MKKNFLERMSKKKIPTDDEQAATNARIRRPSKTLTEAFRRYNIADSQRPPLVAMLARHFTKAQMDENRHRKETKLPLDSDREVLEIEKRHRQ